MRKMFIHSFMRLLLLFLFIIYVYSRRVRIASIHCVIIHNNLFSVFRMPKRINASDAKNALNEFYWAENCVAKINCGENATHGINREKKIYQRKCNKVTRADECRVVKYFTLMLGHHSVLMRWRQNFLSPSLSLSSPHRQLYANVYCRWDNDNEKKRKKWRRKIK